MIYCYSRGIVYNLSELLYEEYDKAIQFDNVVYTEYIYTMGIG
jgi:hypothetical protein